MNERINRTPQSLFRKHLSNHALHMLKHTIMKIDHCLTLLTIFSRSKHAGFAFNQTYSVKKKEWLYLYMLWKYTIVQICYFSRCKIHCGLDLNTPPPVKRIFFTRSSLLSLENDLVRCGHIKSNQKDALFSTVVQSYPNDVIEIQFILFLVYVYKLSIVG